MVGEEALHGPGERRASGSCDFLFYQVEKHQAPLSGRFWQLKRGARFLRGLVYSPMNEQVNMQRKVLGREASGCVSWVLLIPSHALATRVITGGGHLNVRNDPGKR